MTVARAKDRHESAARLHASTTWRLRRTALRLRMHALAEGLAWIAAFAVLAGYLQFALDYGLHGLRWSMRAALAGLVTAAVLGLVWRRIVKPLRRSLGLAQVAHLVEHRHLQLSSLLVSAVRFSLGQVGPPEGNSRAMMAAVIADAEQRASTIDFDSVIDSARWRFSLRVLAAALLLVLAPAVLRPSSPFCGLPATCCSRIRPGPGEHTCCSMRMGTSSWRSAAMTC